MDDNNQEIQSLITMLTAGLEADMSQSANYQAILMLKTSLLSLGVTEAQVYKVLPLVRMSVSENCMERHGNLVKRLVGVLAQLSHKLIQQIDQDFPGQAEVMIPLLMGSSEIDLNF